MRMTLSEPFLNYRHPLLFSPVPGLNVMKALLPISVTSSSGARIKFQVFEIGLKWEQKSFFFQEKNSLGGKNEMKSSKVGGHSFG